MKIRRYKKNDELQILLLFEKVFGHEMSYELWKWKFIDNPETSNPFILVYKENGKILGHISLWIHQAFINGKRKKVALRVDTMVDPDARGRGIYRKLNEQMLLAAKEEKINLLYGFPAPKAKDLLIRYTGATHVVDMPRWIYIAMPFKVASLKLKALEKLSFLDHIYFNMKKMIKNRLTNISKDIKRESIFTNKVNSLAIETKKTHQISLVRDEHYLNWRYVNHPENDYKILCCYKNKQLIGYIVYKVKNNNGVRIGYVIELIAYGENKHKIKTELLNNAIRNMENVAFVQAWSLPHQSTTKAFKQAGFFHKDNPLPLVVNNVSCQDIDVNDSSQWSICLGDVDSY